MDDLDRLIQCTSYKPSKFAFYSSSSDGMSTLLNFSENAVPNSPGNNDGVENIGDAYVNMAVLNVIKEYLQLIQDQKEYSADESYAAAVYLHSRLVSNNILARIHYKSGHNDIDKLRISYWDKAACRAWVKANYGSTPPKVLADLFEANAWLIHQVHGFHALRDHMKALLSPLLPTALSMFERLFYCPPHSTRYTPADHFVYQIQSYRKRDAAKVDEEHIKYLMSELVGIPGNRPLGTAVTDLRSALEHGPSIRFDDDGNIQGTHQRLQLLGHTLLRYYIVTDIDRSCTLNRSATEGVAKFQSTLANLAASDACLLYLVNTLGMDTLYDSNQPLLPRSAAEMFYAAIGMIYESDGGPELLPSVMWCIAGQLVRRSFIALSKASGGKMIPVPSVPANPLEINTFPKEIVHRVDRAAEEAPRAQDSKSGAGKRRRLTLDPQAL